MTQQQKTLFNKANLLYKEERYTEALELFRNLLSMGVAERDIYYRTGITHLKAEQFADAADILGSGIERFPGDDGITYHLALALVRNGNTKKAIAVLEEQNETHPLQPDTMNMLATLYLSAEQYEKALPCFLNVRSNKKDDPDVLYNLGLTYHRLKKYDEAEEAYNSVLKQQPDNFVTANNLGLVLYNKKEFTSSLKVFEDLLAKQPEYADAWYNKANVLRVLEEPAAAVEAYQRALELQPVFSEAMNNLAQIYYEEGNPAQAAQVCKVLTQQEPDEVEWLYNYGIILAELGNDDEAAGYFRKVLSLKPDYTLASYALAEYHLMKNEWQQGWDYYEKRLDFDRYNKNDFILPKNKSDITKGDTILLMEEQGFGDTFEFIRFAKLLAKAGATVYFTGRKSIFPLINSVDGITGCIAAEDLKGRTFTYRIPLCSIMKVLGVTADTLLTVPGYMNWKGKADFPVEKDKLRIGIYWRGNPTPRSNRKRHATLDDMLPVLQQKNVSFYSLQVDPTEHEKQMLKAFGVTDVSETLTSFVETASAINALDLIITIDSGIAHLAGAMNKTVYILLSSIPDWRWNKHGNTSPWYPSAKLFRQQEYRNWNGPIKNITAELEELVTVKVFRNSTEKLFMALTKGENFGWGICSKYLNKEISSFREITVLEKKDNEPVTVDGTVLHALTGADLSVLQNVRGTKNIGYTFFENELSDLSVQNAAKLDLILAGSTWCEQKMNQAGIFNTGTLIQGVDPELFYPVPYKEPSSLFVIFSGGKFELRKGQDLVLRAFKIFSETHPDAVLMTAWYNLWPQTMLSMAHSPHIICPFRNGTYEEILTGILAENEIDPGKVIILGLSENSKMREIYGKTDIGIFPNRCEGGTNLVLMEYMACARPVIVSNNSGHTDVANEDNSFLLRNQQPFLLHDEAGRLISDWKESSIEEILMYLELAYSNRELLKYKGKAAGESMKNFTWNQSARTALRYLLHH